jgi:uncharacterized protein YbcI
MVRAMKRYYGKGPVEARSYFVDDLLFVVMRGVLTTAEGTMIEAGQEDAVRGFRQRFENEMAPQLKSTIERLTGRNVVNYQSQIMFDPDMLIEIFVFDQPMSRDARHEGGSVPAGPDGGGDHDVGGESDEVGGEADGDGGGGPSEPRT